MGGCRCTYKNCTVKTDGVTHLFHYPVFDKVRCHQWLTNAQKLEYLNLKVSQLRNRVVCQHHFKDEMFMNYLKTKLTFQAVPTEDGPFCQPTINISSEVVKEYSITKDDIENEYLSTTEKKANFSVKYGDFLTNSEIMDFEDSHKKLTMDKPNLTNNNSIYPMEYVCHNKTLIMNQNPGNIGVQKKPEMTNVIFYPKPIVVDNNFVELQLSSVNQNQDPNTKKDLILTQTSSPVKSVITPKPKRIKILSEKKICEPIKITGKQLQPASPSTIIKIGNHHNKNNKTVKNVNLIQKTLSQTVKNHATTISTVATDNLFACGTVENSTIPKSNELNQNRNITIEQTNKKAISNLNDNSTSPNSSILKGKTPQERMAAIDEKRKFNMKLRDIIETCLENYDESNKCNKSSQNNDTFKTNNANNLKESDSSKVRKFLSKDPKLASLQGYTMASLEARIKRMEDTLLSRIDQNSLNILELRNTLSLSAPSGRRSSYTQTTNDEEVRKKQLYQEISKYLSPEANSMVYEELFINKFAKKMPSYASSPKKRRKIPLIDVL